MLTTTSTVDLEPIRREMLTRLEALRVADGPPGAYAAQPGGAPDFYASMDVVHIRTVMGEDLRETLSEAERAAWAEHLGGFQDGAGRFVGTYNGLSQHHALGMVIGALGPLGHGLPRRHGLFDDLCRSADLPGWLEGIDWASQWKASHVFWGGIHCFAMSARCTPAWREKALAWLDREIDPATGWWRRGVRHADRHQGLGGAAHIVPIYEHLGARFTYPEALIDSILARQLPGGHWLDLPGYYPVSYLELDALYLLKFARQRALGRRAGDINAAVDRFAAYALGCWETRREEFFAEHPHHWLGFAGAMGLLQQLQPDRFRDTRRWTDIFSDRRLYQTDVACAAEAASP